MDTLAFTICTMWSNLNVAGASASQGALDAVWVPAHLYIEVLVDCLHWLILEDKTAALWRKKNTAFGFSGHCAQAG